MTVTPVNLILKGRLLGIVGAVQVLLPFTTEMDAIFSAVVIELCKRGETKESILNKIQKYPVSKDLKRRLRESLEKVERKEE